jgi:hypothetical protein
LPVSICCVLGAKSLHNKKEQFNQSRTLQNWQTFHQKQHISWGIEVGKINQRFNKVSLSDASGPVHPVPALIFVISPDCYVGGGYFPSSHLMTCLDDNLSLSDFLF